MKKINPGNKSNSWHKKNLKKKVLRKKRSEGKKENDKNFHLFLTKKYKQALIERKKDGK